MLGLTCPRNKYYKEHLNTIATKEMQKTMCGFISITFFLQIVYQKRFFFFVLCEMTFLEIKKYGYDRSVCQQL